MHLFKPDISGAVAVNYVKWQSEISDECWTILGRILSGLVAFFRYNLLKILFICSIFVFECRNLLQLLLINNALFSFLFTGFARIFGAIPKVLVIIENRNYNHERNVSRLFSHFSAVFIHYK